MVEASPANIRDVIGGQKTLPHGIAALLRAVCAKINTAYASGDMTPLLAMADDIAANPQAWVESVTQNTSAAGASAPLGMDFSRVQTGMDDAFATPAARDEVAAQRAVQTGTVAQRRQADSAPAAVHHDAPPNAPR